MLSPAVVTAIVVIVPTVLVVVVVWAVLARRRRRTAMVTWAAARGWTFLPTDPGVRGLRCPPMENDGKPRFVVHGVDAEKRPVVAFEWSHTVTGDGSSDTGGGFDG